MKAIDSPFTKIINGTTQFIIPVFQRDYTWETEQCSQLWRDVLRAARASGGTGHFLGAIVYVPTGDNLAGFTRYLLIDGQQRITTLTLLVIALRDYIQETGWTGDEGDPTPKRLDAYFLKNLQEEGDREQKLVLRRHDQATLRALIDAKRPLPDPGSERLRDNYEHFKEALKEANPSEVYRGIGKLVIVDVGLDRHSDDPQLIFESLNSTGVDLSQSDLIRNYILMRLPEKQQTSLYESYWNKIESLFRGSEWTFDAFARDFVALKTQASKQERADEIYRAFRDFFPDFADVAGSLEQAIAEILRYAGYYAAFSLGRGATGERARRLGNLRKLVDVPSLLVMRLLDCRERSRTFTENELLEGISLIESYVLRRAICGYQTRGYWQVFASMAHRIGDDDPLIDLKVELARQRENYKFPSDEEFMHALQESELYALRACRHLLEGLENYGTKELTDTSGYSIEHIMPQNERLPLAWRRMLGTNYKEIHQVWLNRLGNLTLTGYNSKYSDRPFEEKKTIAHGFADSAVRLNKFVRDQKVWTDTQIESRTKSLAEIAVKCWPSVSVEKSLVDAANLKEMHALAARRDVSKVAMNATAKTLFTELRTKVMSIDSEILELAESRSVSYHCPSFFLEVLPRRYSLTLLLSLDFNEIDDPDEIAEDATQWKFFVHAQYQGGVSISVNDSEVIEMALPLIRQAFAASRS